MEKIRLAILGATGMAGREALLHQQFLDGIGKQYAEITCVTASEMSVGRKLGDIFEEREQKLREAYDFWNIKKCPEELDGLVIDSTDPDIISKKADYVISALDSDVAKKIEPALTQEGVHVFSNASAFRLHENVLLLIPEVNPEHIRMIEKQKTRGKHVCNPNCTTAGYVPLIKSLQDFGYHIRYVVLSTYQALSGKGDAIVNPEYVKRIKGNVIDDWSNQEGNSEEWKSANEPIKILGKPIKIFPHTARVATQNGHLESFFIEFEEEVDNQFLWNKLFATPSPFGSLNEISSCKFSHFRRQCSPANISL